jgi:hypothetical protein
MLSEIFSIPFLICLSISILLIGCSSIYFYQRITQQDHKIESMVSLISSMAEELKGGQPQMKPSVSVPISMSVQTVPIHASTLIPVSDGDDSDSDTDGDGEDSSTYSDSEDSDSDDEEEDKIEIMSNVEELKDPDIDYLEELEMEMEEPKELSGNDIKSIHLEDSLGSLGSLSDLSLFKSIHISGAESDIQTDSITIEESTSYKKMPIQKLREIAQVQGHGDVSKLKKNELLKLLGAE